MSSQHLVVPRPSLSVLAIALLSCSDWSTAAVIIADGAVCSLPDAITAANDNGAANGCAGGDDQNDGADIIQLMADVSLNEVRFRGDGNCGNGLPAITGTLVIEGNGHSITRTSEQGFRLIYATSAKITLRNLTLSGGFSADEAQDAVFCPGGAIIGSDVILENTTVSSNSTGQCGGPGGGIYAGTVTLTNSAVLNNRVCDRFGAGGGGISAAEVTLTNSSVSGNSAENFGISFRMYGGGISAGSVTLTDSSIANNSVFSPGGASGGGISGQTIKLTGSTVSGNTAQSMYYSAQGGGIDGTTVELYNSTVSGNATFIVEQSPGEALGGGVAAVNGTVVNTTIVGNQQAGIAIGAAGIDGAFAISNSIIAGNIITSDGSSVLSDCRGGVTAGPNLIEDGSCGAQLTGSPFVAPLEGNGGPTPTHALLPGSPAIDYGDDSICAALPIDNLDQRGIIRSQGAHCDIGAFEFVALEPFRHFKVEQLAFTRRLDAVYLLSMFKPGSGSDGIDFGTEPVSLSIGTISVTIPAGSFKNRRRGLYTFDGSIQNIALAVAVWRSEGGRQYTFQTLARELPSSLLANPVTVALTIGNDGGTTTAIPRRRR